MNNKYQKGIASSLSVIIIIVVAVLAVGGVLGYQYYWQTSEKEKEVETLTDETANWNVYINEEIGIKFKYPTSYILMDLLKSEEKSILLGDKEFPKPDIAPWYHSPISMRLTNYVNNTAMIDDLADKTASVIEIDGIKSEVIEGKYAFYPSLPNNYRMKIIIIPEKDLTIIIKEYYAGEISDWDEITKIVAKILSTFEFID